MTEGKKYPIMEESEAIDSLSRIVRILLTSVSDPEVYALVVSELDRIDAWTMRVEAETKRLYAPMELEAGTA